MYNIGFWSKSFLYYFTLFISASFGVVSSAVLYLLGKSNISQWLTARACNLITSPAIRVKIQVENEFFMKTRPCVFICNHQSELDILLLGRLFPKYCSIVAKKSLKFVPFLGWFMILSNTTFIDRRNRESAIKTIEEACKQIRDNKVNDLLTDYSNIKKQSAWIFVEGTRSQFKTPDLLPFKKGAFHLAIQARVPIVPIVIANYSSIYHLESRIFKSGVIKVKVLEPIDTTSFSPSDIEQVILETHKKMLKTIKELHQS
ncbi:unnamed protein product [Pneumocystis jirovecii]|uniref:1-acyl-sn-glycerol-3-phosphate acyltransferase n=2 Tax=Pneumocystis jirovecii TaxID=42068 RepID=L0PC89_PNEJI|nr:1-acylglycerol-3-phosphate O-acyltransferase SLC1 [Pneumocystis jirovecii RU7]KTW30935.1 hypothetical protein T551_01487 [Pneumocystis jirovecii RU7]CCJ29968.1 unnamed protein product [Pneumocystis jirovecii]